MLPSIKLDVLNCINIIESPLSILLMMTDHRVMMDNTRHAIACYFCGLKFNWKSYIIIGHYYCLHGRRS